ncbi:putative Secreted protein [Seiridium cardinale]
MAQRGNLTPRTVMAPMAAFTMACLLFTNMSVSFNETLDIHLMTITAGEKRCALMDEIRGSCWINFSMKGTSPRLEEEDLKSNGSAIQSPPYTKLSLNRGKQAVFRGHND